MGEVELYRDRVSDERKHIDKGNTDLQVAVLEGHEKIKTNKYLSQVAQLPQSIP